MTGTVIRKETSSYGVKSGDREMVCSVSNRLRKRLLYPTADPGSIGRHVVAVREIQTVDPVAIGDRVEFREAGPDSPGASITTSGKQRITTYLASRNRPSCNH